MTQRRVKQKSAPAQIRANFKRDALKRDRAEGCRCIAVKARIVPPPPDAEPGTISVLTSPHRSECPISRRRVASPDGTSHSRAEPAVPQSDALAVTPRGADGATGLPVTPSGLWVPGG